MKNLFRKVALLLSFAMIFSAMPMQAFAADPVAKIGGAEYATFSDAFTAAKGMTGDVTVEIYGEVEFVNGMELKDGAYSKITFVGKDTDAKMTVNQTAGGDYLEAHGKTVVFEDLILAKANPAWHGNSGHMGNYFSVQGGTATYNECTFANGACTSGGTATYNDCTFENTSEYGLWVYDDAFVTVNGGKIDSAKGIKVYSEGEDSVTSTLTVKNAEFTENVTKKPAVAIGYAESVTLIGNTYNNAKGVLELDSGSDADCEGVNFTAQDANGNDISSELTAVDRGNGNAACGVLVDGKIYTTVTEAAKDAESGNKVTLLYDSAETVKFPEGVELDKNGYTAGNVTVDSPVASINGTQFKTIKAAFDAVKDGETIHINNVPGSELGKEFEFEFGKSGTFTITGDAPNYEFPVITFNNESGTTVVNIENANLAMPELDARKNATINVINSKIDGAGDDSIAKAYYNGVINLIGDSVVDVMQVTVMGRLNVSDSAKITATWQTNLYGNGIITVNEGATFESAGMSLTGQAYSGRDNTDADRVGKPATVVVDGGTFKTLDTDHPYYYNTAKGAVLGTDTTKGLIEVKNNGTLILNPKAGTDFTVKSGSEIKIIDSAFVADNIKRENGGVVSISGAVKMLEDSTVINGLTVDANATLDLNGKTLNGNILAAAGTTLDIKNGDIVNENGNVSAVETAAKLTLTDVNILSARHAVRVDGDAADVLINNGTYKLIGTGKTQHAVNISGNGAKVVIKDGTFVGAGAPVSGNTDSGAAVNIKAGSVVTIEGGNFSGGKINTLANAGALAISGGTYDQDPTEYLADGYVAVKEAGVYVVKEAEEAMLVSEDISGLDGDATHTQTTVELGKSEPAKQEILNKVADALEDAYKGDTTALKALLNSTDVPPALAAALDNREVVEVVYTVESTPITSATTLTAEEIEEVKAFREVVGDTTTVLNIKVSVVFKVNGAQVATAEFSDLAKEITHIVKFPTDVPAVVTGYERVWKMYRSHDGVIEELPLTVGNNGFGTFASDKYSFYALTFEDRLIPDGGHNWSDDFKMDGEYHWRYCKNCGIKKTRHAHVDVNKDGSCDACDYRVTTTGRENPVTGVTADMLK